MKLCSCGLNWIDDTVDCCEVCNKTQLSLKQGKGKSGIKHPMACYSEEFTFTKEKNYYRGKNGFEAYNAKGENVGLVYMCDSMKTSSYGHCELCIYPAYHNRYGEWHIIYSNGGRIKWERLCEILEKKPQYKVFID